MWSFKLILRSIGSLQLVVLNVCMLISRMDHESERRNALEPHKKNSCKLPKRVLKGFDIASS